MRERFEFRVVEDYAPLLFKDSEGERLGSIRRITLDGDDPRLPQVGKLQGELIAKYDKPFFYGWNIERRYQSVELEGASLLQAMPVKWFEPAGEECGTTYDESADCRLCGSGAQQVGPLRLTKIGCTRVDFASTIANELIVSTRAVRAFTDAGVKGIRFDPVLVGGKARVSPDWFQLVVVSSPVTVVPPTVGQWSLRHRRARHEPLSERPLVGAESSVRGIC